eukprot:CAMPEP_0182867418 /NCGR_PEP_ID=MMETSP0034_2-20130328/8708_1 /TAXON_ID=156128 /ORGANISM="Nephroselmis pyriformis, Strain CCMP717" /LENGTH=1033 /DNA_ID=CAMNT_0024999775 /DNA_START=30 /DNA_END=3131 /DNA_ORIENTATION=-
MSEACAKVFAATDEAGRKAAAAEVGAVVKADPASAASRAAYGDILAAMKSTGKADAEKREGSVNCLEAICAAAGGGALPFVGELVQECFKLAADKVKGVATAAVAAINAYQEVVPPFAVRTVLPIYLKAMDGTKEKPQSVAAALVVTLDLVKKSPQQCAMALADIVPVVTPLMTDIKADVKAGANDVITECCKHIGNRDIEHLLPSLIMSMANPKTTPATIHELAGVVFVSTVTPPALSITVPLLLRGFKERATVVKRQCAVICANMSKLVLEPALAAPFLPKLLPALEAASEDVSDPEARAKCGEARGQLERIKKAADAAEEKRDKDALPAIIAANIKGDEVVSAITGMVNCFVENKIDSQKTWVANFGPLLAGKSEAEIASACKNVLQVAVSHMKYEEEEDDDDDAEELCNCRFTLAYGTKILLHNTDLKLKRGANYGLLGKNDSGKTTLMRAIANGQVEGFPPADELRTVFVEADIQGELSDLACVDYVLADPRIKAANIAREDIQKMLMSVGFNEKMCGDGVHTLSGGWRMKLALARAMLMRADILLLDEPTNHLDVMNVAWVKNYLNSLKTVTAIMVSHDSGLLNDCCTYMLEIENLKLNCHKGNLAVLVEKKPEAKHYFDMTASKLKFKFPQPGFMEGVKNKGKFLMKMDNVSYTYPINKAPTVVDITVRVSLSSRVACVGPNGAGKSTMIKLLTGEVVPQTGDTWKHPACRVAYVAQHAFHHIEQHLNKSPNEYIQWRYQGGDDKEMIQKDTMTLTEEEIKKCQEAIQMDVDDGSGKMVKIKFFIEKLTGARRTVKKENEYEVKFVDKPHEANQFLPMDKLVKWGFGKHIKATDEKLALREGQYQRPLTKDNVEKHLEDVGLDREFGTHHRMAALSGGQKVKVVLAAAMWNQPHILILDEPTNYLDRESLGALAGAIEEFEGGVVMITHNNEFCSKLCPETWVLEKGEDNIGRLETKGDAEWMAKKAAETTEFKAVEEMVDALGNTVKLKAAKVKLSRKDMKKKAKIRAAKIANGEEVSDEEEDFE